VSIHADRIRLTLARGPAGARQLLENMTGVSQPTLSRALAAMGDEVVRWGAARSIRYALRDTGRGVGDIPIHRVGADGTLQFLGVLVPVRPDGFLMQPTDGTALHSDGLPWWLLDMRPQGFLGRAYVAQHAQALGLPPHLSDWRDAHTLRALMAHGHDAVGNLLLGDRARDQFLHSPVPQPIAQAQKGGVYARLAEAAARGEQPGSSAGGEQPKFTAFADTPTGPRHVLVKFSLPDGGVANPTIQRWRDLLLAEHHALQTLAAAGIPAARTEVVDHAGQRFLEVERFDRVGALGRRGVFSLAALEAEFVGDAPAPWPNLVARLAEAGHTDRASAQMAALLHAFGALIGNTDMHHGNLSFISERGRPYTLAPAYDMLPMGFAPRASGAVPAELPPTHLHASVGNATWRQAWDLANRFAAHIRAEPRFSAGFAPCLDGLARHLDDAQVKLARLG
jgi:hypothetical protein